MTNLREAAGNAKGELWQLDSIDLDSVEVKDKTFKKKEKDSTGTEVEKEISYQVMIVNGKEYNIREKQLNQIKEKLEQRPLTKNIRFMKLDDGKIVCLALD